MVIQLPNGPHDMTCEDIEQYTDVYLDEEFSPADRAGFETHLKQCTLCTQHVEHQAEFRASVKTLLPPVAAPAHLRRRIEVALASETSPRQDWSKVARQWGPAFAVAAAIALVLSFPVFETPIETGTIGQEQTPSASPLTIGARTAPRVQPIGNSPEFRSLHRMGPDITGDASAIHAFVQSRVPKTHPPLQERDGLKLSGAREITFQGEPAVMYVYLAAQHRIGVIFAPHLQSSTHTVMSPALERVGELTVGTFSRARTNYAVVSDLSAAALEQALE